MAGLKLAAVTAAIATGTAAKTLAQILAPANHRVQLKRLEISFDGVTNTATPIKVDILRQTTAGTMSSLTPVKRGNFTETLQTTAQHTATAEPTAGDVLRSFYVHPQQGEVWEAPFDDPIDIPGGTRLGVRATASASVNALVALDLEE